MQGLNLVHAHAHAPAPPQLAILPQQQHQDWFRCIKNGLLNSEPQNIAARSMCFQSILNESIAHLNTQLGITPLPKHDYYKCEINPQRHLQFLVDWPGLRISNTPQTKREYEKKSKNWLNGRRAPNYAKTLFPWFIQEAESFCDKTATKLFAHNTEQRRLYFQILIHKVLAQLLGASVTLNEQAKKAPFFCKNSIERKGRLKEILKSFATDHQYAQGFPSCFEEGVDYFDKKSNRFFAVYRQQYICGTGLLQALPSLAIPVIKKDTDERDTKREKAAETSTVSERMSLFGGYANGAFSNGASSGVSYNYANGASSGVPFMKTESIKQEQPSVAAASTNTNTNTTASPVRRLADSITFVSGDISEPLRKRRRQMAVVPGVAMMSHQAAATTTTTNDAAELQFWKNTVYNLQQQLVAERNQRAVVEQERDRYTLILYLLKQQSAKLLMNGTLNTLNAICAQNLKPFPVFNGPGPPPPPGLSPGISTTAMASASGGCGAPPGGPPQQTTIHNIGNNLALNAPALHDLNIPSLSALSKMVVQPPPPSTSSVVPPQLPAAQQYVQPQLVPKSEAAESNPGNELLKLFPNPAPQNGNMYTVPPPNNQCYEEEVKQLLNIIAHGEPPQQ